MKGLFRYAIFCEDPGIEKLLNFTQTNGCFLKPVTPCSLRRTPFTLCTVAGWLANLENILPRSWPATVPSSLLALSRVGQAHLQVAPGRVRLWAFRFLFQCHFVTEYIMTITNHIRRIEDLANQVIEHVDDREYEKAHCALDDIEAKCHAAHRHIDHLQQVTSDFPVPAGG